ncbi:hypothetical protein Acr_29g0009860 [Actinidia rufa]|uniref:Uncharacterized protein n=1 Tax=Actinidia rufa TaxID=165716 RepID=A0A7J0HGD8_9ERIC|nr:hypothetical protein Acr_29g0009860 [Actinidia rufa]
MEPHGKQRRRAEAERWLLIRLRSSSPARDCREQDLRIRARDAEPRLDGRRSKSPWQSRQRSSPCDKRTDGGTAAKLGTPSPTPPPAAETGPPLPAHYLPPRCPPQPPPQPALPFPTRDEARSDAWQSLSNNP